MIEWNGVLYPDIKTCAEALNRSYHTMYYRIAMRGYTCDDDIKVKPKLTPWNGRLHASIGAAARAENITGTAMQYRRDKGYTSDNDLYQYKEKVT